MHRLLTLAAVLALAGTTWADNFLVIPFVNKSADKSLNWIGDSLAEGVTEALASQGLLTIDRDDWREAYQRLGIKPYTLLTKATVLKLGQELDAEEVIYGEFDVKPVPGTTDKTHASLQLSAHMVDLKHIHQGPQYGEVGALEDLAALQRRLEWTTLKSLRADLAPSESEYNSRHPLVRLDALENYVRGLVADTPEQKHKFFMQAVRLEPDYPQAAFQLGRLYLQWQDYKQAIDWFTKIPVDDPHYREATFLLGLSKYYVGDYDGAQQAFQSVARIVPLNEVYNNLGAAESRRNLPEALDSFKKALEGDESDPAYQFNVGYFLWKQGDFDAAAARFRAVLERNPNDVEAKFLLSRAEARNGPRPGDTRTEGLERLKTNYQENAWWQLKAALQPQKDRR